MKRLIMVLCVWGLLGSCAMADPTNYMLQLRPALDFLFVELPGIGVRYQDLRLSPIIRAEHCSEVPVEVGVTAAEHHIVPLLEKIGEFDTKTSRFQTGAIAISVTAEMLPEGGPMLSLTMNHRLLIWLENQPPGNMGVGADLPAFFGKLLSLTTFAPQVDAKSRSAVAKGKKVWLTNLRVDSDRRAQLTGYALDGPAITEFCAEMEKQGVATCVFLSNANRNTYHKVPVWRFDVSARLGAGKEGK